MVERTYIISMMMLLRPQKHVQILWRECVEDMKAILLQTLERLSPLDFAHWSVLSVLNSYSARSMTSEDDDDDDELFANFDTDHRDDLVMEWAKGGVLDFQPLEHLQSIEYMRPPVSSLGVYDKYSDSLESSKKGQF